MKIGTDMSKRGQNSLSGVENWTWNGYAINLNENARYEFVFTINLNGNGGENNPIFNFYLAAPNNSILFGNHYDVGGIGGQARGAAGIYHYSGDASNGDLVDAAPNTYILNQYCDDGGGVYWKQSLYKDTASTGVGQNWTRGYHTYRIIIESFSDAGVSDKIKFLYDGPNGNGWTQDYDISTLSGISADRSGISVGYYIAKDGVPMSVDLASFTKYSRTETPLPEPDPVVPPVEPSTPITPDVPEPSAFGLLAGLGAIVLAVSRRRRK